MLGPYRDMFAARARERLALEAAPAIAQRHARELGHQVELGGPGIAERARVADRAAAGRDLEVMRDQALVGDVVLVEADPVLTDVPRFHGLPRRQPLEARDPDLDHERPARLQMRRGVA